MTQSRVQYRKTVSDDLFHCFHFIVIPCNRPGYINHASAAPKCNVKISGQW